MTKHVTCPVPFPREHQTDQEPHTPGSPGQCIKAILAKSALCTLLIHLGGNWRLISRCEARLDGRLLERQNHHLGLAGVGDHLDTLRRLREAPPLGELVVLLSLLAVTVHRIVEAPAHVQLHVHATIDLRLASSPVQDPELAGPTAYR